MYSLFLCKERCVMDVGYGWFRVYDSAMVQVRGELFCGLIQIGTDMEKRM